MCYFKPPSLRCFVTAALGNKSENIGELLGVEALPPLAMGLGECLKVPPCFSWFGVGF